MNWRAMVAGCLLALMATPLATGSSIPADAQQEAALVGVAQIGAGNTFSCALLVNQEVRCWGADGNGQLGEGDLGGESDLPVVVRNVADTGPLTGVTQLSVGGNHACARLSNGRAVCWGEGSSRQLGNGDATDSDLPVFVRNAADTANLAGVAQVAAGILHSCAVVTGGQARCWGENGTGQIGNGDAPNDAPTPQAVRNAADSPTPAGAPQTRAEGTSPSASPPAGRPPASVAGLDAAWAKTARAAPTPRWRVAASSAASSPTPPR